MTLIPILCALSVLAADSPQFRGPNRDGVFPAKQLMSSWPDSGPNEIWATEGLGEGFASVAIVGDRIYTTGSPQQTAYVYALDTDGTYVWKTRLGAEHPGGGYPGSRSTPTVDGDFLYVLTGSGILACLKTSDGSVVWQHDAPKDMNAAQENSYFGMAENVLIDGDHVIFTPGSSEGTVMALNKLNGEVIWKSKGTDQKASFCSIRVFESQHTRQLITMTASAMLGVDPNNGQVKWQYDYPAQYAIHAVSPVFHGNQIYVSDGYGQGGTGFQLSEDGSSIKKMWKEDSLDIHHGGAVTLDGYVYGTSNKGHLICLDMMTGSVVAEVKDVGKGSTVYADGRLYCYGEKGQFSLVDPNPKNMKVVSSFKVEKGSSHHWAHPVITDGRLYVRHGDVLLAYNIAR
ncbi:MAG: PQQ-like beta-propeller repeat protein [Acidobacteria bacterium]|nr:PQQ-like beta-propeller repeat protein [Acidobacteriota bacterium]